MLLLRAAIDPPQCGRRLTARRTGDGVCGVNSRQHATGRVVVIERPDETWTRARAQGNIRGCGAGSGSGLVGARRPRRVSSVRRGEAPRFQLRGRARGYRLCDRRGHGERPSRGTLLGMRARGCVPETA